ncbi:MAG: TonB-dependent receptor [Gammaproteobacteria bacterium]|nr:TonB-dependent receptor [Gammaproteobacteria bacterium]
MDLSLEQLGNIEVTSVSKKQERLLDAPASIYVITGEAIRRAGVYTLPEALRLAPNLQVARINSSQYAISARGFNSSTANKLLVMLDGRTIYTPLYSGVFWDAPDVILEDVDRIEVISGPGGTLWGANAVNGVINIITKPTEETMGNFASVVGGNTGQSLAVRHGGALGGTAKGNYRVYAKFNNFEHSITASGNAVPDAWEHGQVGFRSDWNTVNKRLTLKANIYQDAIHQATASRQHNNGGNILGRCEQILLDGSNLRTQLYYDHTTRDYPGRFSEKLDMLDVDLQHALPVTVNHQLIWGGGYRIATDRVRNSSVLAFLPADRDLHWGNLFVQQEWILQPELRFTAGSKLESNDYTGLEFLPNVKLAWKPHTDTLLWTALSRAVRAPSRIDKEFYANIPLVTPNSPTPTLYSLQGGPDFRSEIATTLDLGLRHQVGTDLSYSLTVFFSRYDRLRSLDTLPGNIAVLGNQIKARVEGLEAWGSYQLATTWSLNAGVVLQQQHFEGDNVAQSSPGNDPHSQWRLGSKWDLSDAMEWDVSIRHVGDLPSPAVAAYTAVDTRLGWYISRTAQLAVTAQNLFDPRHPEFAASSTTTVANTIQVERAIDVTLTVKF